jgi:cyclophilin family peptidyl-prolyl cis-trans isomerase
MLSIAVAVLTAQVSGAAPAAPAATPAWSKGPVVVMQTSKGRIVLGLDRGAAPLSVANFVQYAHARFYDGTIFHRVIRDFMIQGGGFDQKLVQKATRAPVRNESKSGLSNRRGTVALARTPEPHSATAQFFINLVDNTRLDGSPSEFGYAVFGEVLEGMDVVDSIAAGPTQRKSGYSDVPVETVVIQSVREQARPRPAVTPSPVPAKSPTARRTRVP